MGFQLPTSNLNWWEPPCDYQVVVPQPVGSISIEPVLEPEEWEFFFREVRKFHDWMKGEDPEGFEV